MRRMLLLLVVLATVTPLHAAEQNRMITDREALCKLELGRYIDGNYVGSTPMADACLIENYEARATICKNNYDRPEIINACILTYDAGTEMIRRAQENNRSQTK